ncbi:MAG: sugar phosphate isomerase/epimerase [Bacteroidetes bacterium]|nr:MAG: sugar phosphate isomerase/epimerase [Bacteroidota bacterium]
MNRKTFLKYTAAAMTATALAPATLGRMRAPSQPLIKKSLKYGMIKEDLSILDKFKLVKDLGFHGVEMDSPNELDDKEILEARDKSGIEIPGVVNSVHWKAPLSDPDPAVRAKCVESMKTALHACKRYGGTTVLLVPAVVNEQVSYADAYRRSQEEIRKLLPLAEETGINIAIENVWNNFLLSPLEAARYIDEFESPRIGWYFDVGNIIRYGWAHHWIEALGQRIMKIDVKEYSRDKQRNEGIWAGFRVEIGDGDCDWAKVNAALRKVGYSGWGSAEVPGGDRKRLKEISERMDKIYAL